MMMMHDRMILVIIAPCTNMLFMLWLADPNLRFRIVDPVLRFRVVNPDLRF